MYDWQFLEAFFTRLVPVEYWRMPRRESEGEKKKGYMGVEGRYRKYQGCW